MSTTMAPFCPPRPGVKIRVSQLHDSPPSLRSHTIITKTVPSTARLHLVVIFRGTSNHSSYLVHRLRVRNRRRRDRYIQVIRLDSGSLIKKLTLKGDIAIAPDGRYQAVLHRGNAGGITHSGRAARRAAQYTRKAVNMLFVGLLMFSCLLFLSLRNVSVISSIPSLGADL